jgi:hypothetical protein
MPSKSLWKIVEFIKFDCEEWGEPLQIDEAGLYRHVKEMLDLEQVIGFSLPLARCDF